VKGFSDGWGVRDEQPTHPSVMNLGFSADYWYLYKDSKWCIVLKIFRARVFVYLFTAVAES
jgi:hypothetical protein